MEKFPVRGGSGGRPLEAFISNKWVPVRGTVENSGKTVRATFISTNGDVQLDPTALLISRAKIETATWRN